MAQKRSKRRPRSGRRRLAAGHVRAMRNLKSRKKLSASAASAMPALPLKQPEKFADPKAIQQLKTYEVGVKYFHQQKFDRAKELFEKSLAGPSKELAERAQVHLNICRQKLTRSTIQLKSPDDHYYYAVSMINMGRFEEACVHLLRARKGAPRADYVHYALAILSSLAGDPEAALEHLRRAIELRPENRFHARYDEDFDILREDPRFTELIYPERDMPS